MLSDYITPCSVGNFRILPKFGSIFPGWPFEVNYTTARGLVAWVLLPGGWSVSWRVAEDPYQERELWRLGPLSAARSLTPEELEDDEFPYC